MNKGIIINALKKCVKNQGHDLNIYDQVALMDAVKYIETKDAMWERLKKFLEVSGNAEAINFMKELEDENR